MTCPYCRSTMAPLVRVEFQGPLADRMPFLCNGPSAYPNGKRCGASLVQTLAEKPS